MRPVQDPSADTMDLQLRTTDIGREGVAAVLAADLSNGTPPSAAVKAGKRSVRRQYAPEPERERKRGFGRG